MPGAPSQQALCREQAPLFDADACLRHSRWARTGLQKHACHEKTAARQDLSTTRDDESVRAIPEKCLARARKPFRRPFRPDFPNTKSRILPAGPKRISLAQRCSGTTLAGQSCWVCTAEVAQTQASPGCSGRPCNVWLSTLREVILSNWPRRMKSWSWSAELDTAL